MSLSKVLEIARGELGQTENPAGSNLTKYGFWYGVDGVPWCVIFLCWLFDHAGERMAFFGGGKTASCRVLLRWYREQGLTVPVEDVQVGDIVILNFHGTQDTEHCGLVVDADGTYVATVEGNTSPGLEGSQDNGGCVAYKRRTLKQIVAVCRPQYLPELEITDIKPDYADHWARGAIIRAINKGLMEGYPDGSFRPDQPVTRGELATILMRLEEK